jgi:hypothetical protein
MFSGQLPAKLFEIAALETIALSVNCFTGELPTTLCDAERAIVVSLDGLGELSFAVIMFRNFVMMR